MAEQSAEFTRFTAKYRLETRQEFFISYSPSFNNIAKSLEYIVWDRVTIWLFIVWNRAAKCS